MDHTRRDGTIVGTTYHTLESAALPAAVVEQARAILEAPSYEQASLFEGE